MTRNTFVVVGVVSLASAHTVGDTGAFPQVVHVHTGQTLIDIRVVLLAVLNGVRHTQFVLGFQVTAARTGQTSIPSWVIGLASDFVRQAVAFL
jgi:hypothetical protein